MQTVQGNKSAFARATRLERALTGEVAVALARVRLYLLRRELAELNAVCTVNFLADDLDLLRDGLLELIQVLELGRA